MRKNIARTICVHEIEKNHYVDIIHTRDWEKTTTDYVDILQHTHTRDWENYVDLTEYVYLF